MNASLGCKTRVGNDGPRKNRRSLLETSFHRDICTVMIIAAQLVITKPWNHSKCSSMDEWTKKKWVFICSGVLLSLKEG